MKIIKILFIGIIVGSTILAATLTGQAAPVLEPAALASPIIISDNTFNPADWQVYDVINQGGGSYQVRQETNGGNPGAYRWIEQVVPPVPTGQVYQISLTHLYLGANYDPASQGAIATLDYSESVRIVASNNPQPFVRSIPIVVQGGRIYRATAFLDSFATASWESLSLSGLDEQDFIAFDDANAHPDFSAQGQPISFGFFRGLSRTQTAPAIPANQNLTLQHGIDNWQVTITPMASGNNPPVANNDIYVVETAELGLINLTLGVLGNDFDPDGDTLTITNVAPGGHGSTSAIGGNFITYIQLGRERDNFTYTVSDGELSATAGVGIYVDCGCSISCLMEQVAGVAVTDDNMDLALIRRLRDRVMRPTPDGNRYVDMYYTTTPEIAKILMLDRTDLGDEAVALVELWQDNLYSLVDGDGSAVITQPQIDAMETFLANLSAAGSSDLQQIISDEQTRLGPLDDYVGLTVKQAKHQAIGDATVYMPLVIK
ncbi:MAG: cadherin-like domain-containing protein [Anaerolineae bacterium]|nr:cadherin-like domain-containing protein [Anaerolineae bacterium]